jgi:UDP-N-acetylmuramate dehydrogenase
MPVIIERDVGLAPYNTFGVDAHAAYFARIASAADLDEVLADPKLRALPRLVLGGGSNLLLTRDFDGLVLHVEIPGFESGGVEAGCQLVRVGAGQSWHGTVERTLHEGLPGLENLALIPGAIGAAPIQNIGAYGIELAERFHSLEALDTETGERLVMDALHCRFGYRDSLFKQVPGRYIVVAVTLALPQRWQPVAGYADVAGELRTRGIAHPGPRDVFDAVVAIRRRKLPALPMTAGSGSFFKNPVVSRRQRDELIAHHPSLVSYDIGGGRCKLAAGWLIESCGLKGYVRGRAAVYERQALVLVNRGGATGTEILQLAAEVQDRVAQKFGVKLEPEPLIV